MDHIAQLVVNIDCLGEEQEEVYLDEKEPDYFDEFLIEME
jgi:hypothetical protein